MPVRKRVRGSLLAAMSGVALAASMAAPVAANASVHTCVAGDICVYNSASYQADPPSGGGVVNPWNAITGNYYDLDGATDPTNPNAPSPHTYNNPDVCNTNVIFAASKACNENDSISSVKNRNSSRDLRLFNDAFYRGSYQTMSALTSLSQVRNNDQITSFCLSKVGSCPF